MKAFVLVAVLVLSVSVASAQSMTSVLLHHVREANLVIEDRTHTLSATHLDTLRQRLEKKFGGPGGGEQQTTPPVLRLIIEEHELENGWYHVAMAAELTETVQRVQDPPIITRAVTWRARSGSIVNARLATPFVATWHVLDKLTENILALASDRAAQRRHSTPDTSPRGSTCTRW